MQTNSFSLLPQASILRSIVAGPRSRHPEAGLDLCYVTDNSKSPLPTKLQTRSVSLSFSLTTRTVVATSGPSSTYPKKAYRNPTDQLVRFLDHKHGADWSIFEFRAEGTGYPDSEVYNRIHHFPWPDHHPPPFAIIPPLMASMRNWLMEGDRRVAVVHCKAGKGRSGTVTTAYLISQEGWDKDDALARFTERRMRQGFGNGVSIPSQLRWVDYVDRWTNQMRKMYVERKVEIVEVHVWGLRDGVKVSVEGYVEEGRRIETVHTFTRKEKVVVDDGKTHSESSKNYHSNSLLTSPIDGKANNTILSEPTVSSPSTSTPNFASTLPPTGQTVLLKPSSPVILPTSDINIDFERRNKAAYTGWTMVTSVTHVWFNAYFEGGHEGTTSGVFEIEWDAMDGIKGSARKGTRALDRVKVLWRYVEPETEELIREPGRGENVKEPRPADWRGKADGDDVADHDEKDPVGGISSRRPGGAALTVGATVAEGAELLGKNLGLRKDKPESRDLSRASSATDLQQKSKEADDEEKMKRAREEMDGDSEDELKGVMSRGPGGGDLEAFESDGEGGHRPTTNAHHAEVDTGNAERNMGNLGVGKVAGMVKGMKASNMDGEQ